MPLVDAAGVVPKIVPELDRGFVPAVLFHQVFDAAARAVGGPTVRLAIEQADGSIYRWTTLAFPESHPGANVNFLNLERQVKFLLWSRGGFRVYVDGPQNLTEALQQHYVETATGRFDAEIMTQIYEKPLEVVRAGPGDLPEETPRAMDLGKHLDGC